MGSVQNLTVVHDRLACQAFSVETHPPAAAAVCLCVLALEHAPSPPLPSSFTFSLCSFFYTRSIPEYNTLTGRGRVKRAGKSSVVILELASQEVGEVDFSLFQLALNHVKVRNAHCRFYCTSCRTGLAATVNIFFCSEHQITKCFTTK